MFPGQKNRWQTRAEIMILMVERAEPSAEPSAELGVELGVEPDEINIKNIQKQNVVVEKVINNIIIIYNAT